MTLQEAFNLTYTYFSKPGAILAKSDHGSCEYRTDQGRKCAVGRLVPDKLYTELMEGSAWTDLVHEANSFFGLSEPVTEDDRVEYDQFQAVEKVVSYIHKGAESPGELDALLTDMQTAHDDRASDAEHLCFILRNDVAPSYGLTVPATS